MIFMFNLAEQEQEILKFWQEAEIFKKSLEKDAPQGDFVFYDGPPFATGTPHYGHIVASLMKDIVPRYFTMKGFRVERKWGWDTHGLPIENIVEEEMNIKSKKEIEEIGVDKFNEACRSKVMIYAKEWRQVVERMGRWVDMDNDYKTMDKDYMESIWRVFKELWDKNLIYESYKSMHICPRCETTLSQSEVTEGYKDVKDISGTFKFELEKGEIEKLEIKGLDKDDKVFVLAWTTTPWTLIGNVALAVGKDIEYVKIKNLENGEIYFVANDLASRYVSGKIALTPPTVKGNIIKGKDLEGLKYKPLFPYYLDKNLENKENLYTIQTADFVSIEDGTGVVHIAPAFGEEDMNLGEEKNLPFIQHVNMNGQFIEDVKDFAGQEVKPKDDPMETDRKVIEFLDKKGLVFAIEEYEHSYPHCWRCESPLLNYATNSWFVSVTKIKDAILKNAKDINWVPAHIKEGRFGQWLEGARDWSISRQRFWGSVMPIWVCEKCGEKKVIGSVVELEKLSGVKINDLHKHFIDKITFKCEKCNSEMKRIPDVLDCWFESGSMPYAQNHYPFENKDKFEKNFPAEFIAEGVDQTTKWFYYLHVLSTALKNSQAFKNVVVNGIVLAEDGKKMSKRLNNYPDPMEVMNKYGADAVRYYLCSSQVMKADNLNFSEKDLVEQSRWLNALINVLTFYKMFAKNLEIENLQEKDLSNVLDKWITARLEETKKKITQKMDNYDLHAIREIPVFVDDLSTWYVRRSRERFKGEDELDKKNALRTLRRVLYHLARITAPFMPFTAEYIYSEMGADAESVHLKEWPKIKEERIDQKVLDYMDLTCKVVELGLAARAEAGIKVRQPLQQLKINNSQLSTEYTELIKDEVNVKEVVQEKGEGELKVELNTEITPELKLEGYLRELVRTINQMRKKQGMTIEDRIEINYQTDNSELKQVFDQFGEELKKQTLASELQEGGEELEEVKVNEKKILLGIRNI